MTNPIQWLARQLCGHKGASSRAPHEPWRKAKLEAANYTLIELEDGTYMRQWGGNSQTGFFHAERYGPGGRISAIKSNGTYIYDRT